MQRLYAISCLLALFILNANLALGQQVIRTPIPKTHGVLRPMVPLPNSKLGNKLIMPVPTRALPLPPPSDARMCCPCAGRTECSDVCCFKR
jgi:hypothetical protein